MESGFCGTTVEFERLIGDNKLAVYSTALSHISVRANADDVVQETFIYAYYNYGRLNDPNKLKAWLCGIARNLSLKMLRSVKANVSLDEIEESAAVSGPESEYEVAETRRELTDAIKNLSNPLAETITLHYLADMSIREIAGILAIPEGTVKWRLNEGRKKLKKELGKIMDDERKKIEANEIEKQIRNYIELAQREVRADRNRDASVYCDKAFALIGDINDPEEMLAELYRLKARSVLNIEGRKVSFDYELKRYDLILKTGDLKAKIEAETGIACIMSNMGDKEGSLSHNKLAIELADESGDKKFLAYANFWLGAHFVHINAETLGLEYFIKALNYAEINDEYSTAPLAKSAIQTIESLQKYNRLEKFDCIIASVDILKKENGVIKLKSEPGFGADGPQRGQLIWNIDIFYMAQEDTLLDNRFADGYVHEWVNQDAETRNYRMSAVGFDEKVTVSAGTFEHCLRIHKTGDPVNEKADIWYAPGVGIIKIDYDYGERGGSKFHSQLAEYEVKPVMGGDFCSKYLPLVPGNKWRYEAFNDDGTPLDSRLVYENWQEVYDVTGDEIVIRTWEYGFLND